MRKIRIIPIKKLKPHEQTDKKNLERIKNDIHKTGCISNPVVVERDNLVILDGHHRTKALQLLGCTEIPVYLVDYFNDEIEVSQRRPEIKISKEIIIKKALAGKLFPKKTSKHFIPDRPINLNISLEALKGNRNTAEQAKKE
ncbi:MAG: ParB N-terminal domain-containing protein [Parcubacteria group bacterium]|jgi:hypothetical protein